MLLNICVAQYLNKIRFSLATTLGDPSSSSFVKSVTCVLTCYTLEVGARWRRQGTRRKGQRGEFKSRINSMTSLETEALTSDVGIVVFLPRGSPSLHVQCNVWFPAEP